MKRFKFKFEKLETLRQIERDREIQKVAIKEKRVQEILQDIHRIELSSQDELSRIKASVNRGYLDGQDQRLSSTYRKDLKRQLDELRYQLVEAKAEVIRARRILVEKQKSKKVLEKLREKAKERHEEEFEKLEERELDEMASNNWTYRSNSND